MALIRKDTSDNNAASTAFHTILGSDSSFNGKLTFKGSVRIEGRFQGEIETEDRVMIVDGAVVEAQVSAGNIELSGTLRGNVFAKRQVTLMAPAKLYGDVETPSLVIHDGVIFEGSCRMENLTGKPKMLTTKGDDDGDGDGDGDGDD